MSTISHAAACSQICVCRQLCSTPCHSCITPDSVLNCNACPEPTLNTWQLRPMVLDGHIAAAGVRKFLRPAALGSSQVLVAGTSSTGLIRRQGSQQLLVPKVIRIKVEELPPSLQRHSCSAHCLMSLTGITQTLLLRCGHFLKASPTSVVCASLIECGLEQHIRC